MLSILEKWRGPTFSFLLDRWQIFLVDLEIHRDSSRFDRNTTFFLVFSRIRKSHVTGILRGNDTSLGHKRIGKSGLSVVN
jgi:hypothetical protein